MKKYIIYAIVVIAIVWGGLKIYDFIRPMPGDEVVWVKIPRGFTPDQLRDSLTTAFGESYGASIADDLISGEDEIHPGAYRFDPGTRAFRILRYISRGMQTPVKFTFNNIRTLDQFADIVSARLDISKKDFLKVCRQMAASEGFTTPQLAAQFLPDSYEVYWTATPQELIHKLQNHYKRFWTEERIAQAKKLGLSPYQLSILASIAEEESNSRPERPVIARLYMNRLNRGMLLQADPTVKFATGDFSARRITAAMLKTDSPFNTYRVKGLPPAPIRFPEAATIDAILNSAPHNYIYMCAKSDGSGTHNFTADYATHLANARAFRLAAYGK